ncbi:hypothetical protein [Streptomyces sp. CRN 30]|uniref:hypothetical protein n=1 Tax=Streptomyces sp. CRN 30 TaxID=3075613 RepID=UPI002A82BC8F|nr:hypothetical protein [Streptomyces sp. CRN 30]
MNTIVFPVLAMAVLCGVGAAAVGGQPNSPAARWPLLVWEWLASYLTPWRRR